MTANATTVLDPARPIADGDPTERVRRGATTGLAVLGPVLFVVSNVIYPSLGHSTAAVVAHIAPIADRVLATHLIYALASLLLVPFALAVWRIPTRRGAVLRLIGGLLVVVGGICNAFGEAVLAYSAWGMHGAGVPAADQVRFFDLLDNSAAALPIGFVAIPVLSLGLLLLMVGVLLSRVVPAWLPALVIVGAVASGFVGTGIASALGLVWALPAGAIVWLVATGRAPRS